MDIKEVSALANVVMAFSTFVAGGGALAYYLKEVIEKSALTILLVEAIYITMLLLTIITIRRKIK